LGVSWHSLRHIYEKFDDISEVHLQELHVIRLGQVAQRLNEEGHDLDAFKQKDE
jgi:hypothetical protein